MIQWLIYGASMLGIGAVLMWIYSNTGPRRWLHISPGHVAASDRSVGSGEVVSYPYLVRGLGITTKVLWKRASWPPPEKEESEDG